MEDNSSASSVKGYTTGKPSSGQLPIRRYFPTKFLTQQKVQLKLAFLRSVRHQNLDSPIKAFYNAGANEIEAGFEYLPVDVMNLGVRAFPFLKQINLAAILGQASFAVTIIVLQGLLFLDLAGLRHSWFVESQIMADLEGNIKIGGMFWCEKGEMMTMQLLPLIQRLMFPWLYSDDVAVDATKWPQGCPARQFWRSWRYLQQVSQTSQSTHCYDFPGQPDM
ncbi:kinase-like domain [Cordyceps militaris]|uniref:Kinase-like domain n=1 Tax=Cordyceps militaris TaxID=73501 RepID=A0A2H4S575_CORMI|nr:kinase-like domain [Cordyceps militaris]